VCAVSRREEYNHDWVGSTEDAPPLPGGLQRDGWVLDHNRIQVRGSVRVHVLVLSEPLERM